MMRLGRGWIGEMHGPQFPGPVELLHHQRDIQGDRVVERADADGPNQPRCSLSMAFSLMSANSCNTFDTRG